MLFFIYMKEIYINLPVKDLEKSTAFYEALGFVKNPMFSNESASAMVWSDNIIVMLLVHSFYTNFIKEKTISDTHKTSGVLLALSFDSKESVQKFADTAKQQGGNYYMSDINKGTDFMFGYEVEDLDGHLLEPFYMDITKFPKN